MRRARTMSIDGGRAGGRPPPGAFTSVCGHQPYSSSRPRPSEARREIVELLGEAGVYLLLVQIRHAPAARTLMGPLGRLRRGPWHWRRAGPSAAREARSSARAAPLGHSRRRRPERSAERRTAAPPPPMGGLAPLLLGRASLTESIRPGRAGR